MLFVLKLTLLGETESFWSFHFMRQQQPKTIKRLGNDGLQIVWKDGHQSEYTYPYLRRVVSLCGVFNDKAQRDRMFIPYSVQTDSAIQTRFLFQPIPNRLTLSLLVVTPSSLLGAMVIRRASTLLKHSEKSVPGVSQGRLGEETLDVRPPDWNTR